ncbi:uncharacterized protein ACHE_20909S [Aspergillus chevalieri]|uniref:Uncharacterized protein n=1 Tax=Aspergillus chevalieri TaxID=182096 RepID=A0A7R7VIR7_ASPCH|nr:uncharacterized protein ACHE_20909S [Aspergillus chevalieri]BCR85451.1 hypothetical protein ACHE_20909S [Aspergillus chevalieri]
MRKKQLCGRRMKMQDCFQCKSKELQGRLPQQTSSEDALDVHDTYLHETGLRSPVSPTGADQGLSDQLST